MRFRKEYRIGCHDCDTNENLKPSLLQRFMMETADRQMRERKPTYAELFEDGKAFILTKITIEIEEQLHPEDIIQMETWNCPKKGATFVRCFEAFRDGKSVATGHSTWVVVNHITGKICRPSEIDISNYERDDALEMNHPTKFRIPKDMELEKVGEKKVLYSEVDINLHLNNTYYGDVLWSYIPDVQNIEVTSVNLHFHKEAALNEVMEIYMSKVDDDYYFKTFVNGQLNVEAIIGTKKLNQSN